MRIVKLEAALARLRHGWRAEQAQAKRQAALIARDVIVERFGLANTMNSHRKWPACCSLARQSLETCCRARAVPALVRL